MSGAYIDEIRVTRGQSGRITEVKALAFDRPGGRLITAVNLPTTKIKFEQRGNDLGLVTFSVHGGRVKFIEDDSE